MKRWIPSPDTVAMTARESPRKVPRIVIIQRRMTHYRVPLFQLMRDKFRAAGVELAVAFGDPTAQERKNMDSGILSWGTHVPCRYFFDGNFCWQNAHGLAQGADLVILAQENKLLLNHLLMLRKRRFKLAFWGHGANLQTDRPNGWKECYKRWTTNQVDWWFAYTQLSATLVRAAGFPHDRITLLNNAVDSSELHWQRQSITPEETASLRRSVGFGNGPTGVYVGSLYPGKRLDFLFSACEAIRREVPDFQLLVLGDGPERDCVRAWCATHSWARWVGARFGREKVAYLSLAHVLLNPGALGLSIMDSFVCQVPMITTDFSKHGPEISYLQHGVNGVVTRNDLDAYIKSTINLLNNEQERADLRLGCSLSALEYTVENMSGNFVEGAMRCLEIPRNRDFGAS